MPLIDYTALRGLVAELDLLKASPDGHAHRRRREDLQYTVCIYTGERDAARALETARRLLAARPAPAVSGVTSPGRLPGRAAAARKRW
ncbi:DUF5133 domain-containing protein [Kitasatospora sp. GP82]|uniref:DUF5133 domain-containing protein n=1 Tax=Kitasatospora sp. GP82 TaxID=3035089 RepID=UPI002473FE7F|nr:DUF5133 domain-containing protein [Kitasatospora sp. GP82]MDH6125460.1 hypothetical protein [Kitasatospora sp. GP82]